MYVLKTIHTKDMLMKNADFFLIKQNEKNA